MVSYKPLWETMKEKNITTYTLIYKYNLNPRTINNLKHDRGITVDTLEKLCKILDCTPNDIITFVDKVTNHQPCWWFAVGPTGPMLLFRLKAV